MTRSSSRVRPIISRRSWPAENTGPSARITITRVADSADSARSPIVTSRIADADNGFR